MRDKNFVILQNQDTSSTQLSGATHIRKLFNMDEDREIKIFRSNIE
jgi:hypothetical protein